MIKDTLEYIKEKLDAEVLTEIGIGMIPGMFGLAGAYLGEVYTKTKIGSGIGGVLGVIIGEGLSNELNKMDNDNFYWKERCRLYEKYLK